MMQSVFVKSLPTGYHNPLSGKVINMETKLQNTKSSSVANTTKPDVMYQRELGLACIRDIDLREIFSYELSTLPLSLFKENGEMRLNNKSEIRTKVASLVSARKDVPTFKIIDGCALLWVVYWPPNDLVSDYIQSLFECVMHHLEECVVFLVSDRNVPDSVKHSTRISRADNTLDEHRLRIDSLLSAKNVCLNVTENKLQLIELIFKHLPELMKVRSTSNHLVIYGQQDEPLDI